MIKKLLVILLVLTTIGCKPNYISRRQWIETLNAKLFIGESPIDNFTNWGIDIGNDLNSPLDIGYVDNIYQQFAKQKLPSYFNLKQINEIDDDIINKLNNRNFDNQYEIDYKDSLYLIDDYTYQQGQYIVSDDVEVDNYIVLDQTYGQVFKVESVNRVNGFSQITLSPIDFNDLVNTMEVQGSVGANLNNAKIEFADEVIANNSPYIQLGLFDNQFNINGYQINFSHSNSSINIYVSKNNDKINYYGDFDISNMKFDYRFKYANNQIEDAFFKLAFNSKMKLGMEKARYKDIDFEKNLLSYDLKKYMSTISDKLDYVEQVIPFVKIKMPIAAMPTLAIDLELQLHFYASGKMEIVTTSSSAYGLEIKNNQLRIINDNKSDIDYIMRASANATLGIEAALSCLGIKLVNVVPKAGVGGVAKAIVHLYNNNDYLETIDIDASADDIADIDNDNFKLCVDLSLHWIAGIWFNTNSTIAGKLNLSHKIEFLNEKNQIFSDGAIHLENWQNVKQCTRHKKVHQTIKPIEIEKGLTLVEYQVSLNPNETHLIEFLSLPDDITEEDLQIKCQKAEVCKVSGKVVHALNSGSSTIEIIYQDKCLARMFLIVR